MTDPERLRELARAYGRELNITHEQSEELDGLLNLLRQLRDRELERGQGEARATRTIREAAMKMAATEVALRAAERARDEALAQRDAYSWCIDRAETYFDPDAVAIAGMPGRYATLRDAVNAALRARGAA